MVFTDFHKIFYSVSLFRLVLYRFRTIIMHLTNGEFLFLNRISVKIQDGFYPIFCS